MRCDLAERRGNAGHAQGPQAGGERVDDLTAGATELKMQTRALGGA